MAWIHPWLPYSIIALVLKSYFRAVPQTIYFDTLIFGILFYHTHTVAAPLKLLSALLWEPGLCQCTMIPFNTGLGINPFPSYLIKG